MASISQQDWLDTVLGSYGGPDHPLRFALFGPKFLAKHLYQLSPVQVSLLSLVKTLSFKAKNKEFDSNLFV